MPSPSLAQTFFVEIASAPAPVAFLRSLVTQHQPEQDWLDFKTVPAADHEIDLERSAIGNREHGRRSAGLGN